LGIECNLKKFNILRFFKIWEVWEVSKKGKKCGDIIKSEWDYFDGVRRFCQPSWVAHGVRFLKSLRALRLSPEKARSLRTIENRQEIPGNSHPMNYPRKFHFSPVYGVDCFSSIHRMTFQSQVLPPPESQSFTLSVALTVAGCGVFIRLFGWLSG